MMQGSDIQNDAEQFTGLPTYNQASHSPPAHSHHSHLADRRLIDVGNQHFR